MKSKKSPQVGFEPATEGTETWHGIIVPQPYPISYMWFVVQFKLKLQLKQTIVICYLNFFQLNLIRLFSLSNVSATKFIYPFLDINLTFVVNPVHWYSLLLFCVYFIVYFIIDLILVIINPPFVVF